MSPTSFTFTTLEGHFDAPGSTVKFLIQEQDVFLLGRSIVLVQKARALRPDEGSLRHGLEDLVIVEGARQTWARQAMNLRRAVNPSCQISEPRA